MGEGPRVMVRKVWGRVVRRWDCWRRVLRRSAGWKRKAARAPEERPEAKWERCEMRPDSVAVEGPEMVAGRVGWWGVPSGMVRGSCRLVLCTGGLRVYPSLAVFLFLNFPRPH